MTPPRRTTDVLLGAYGGAIGVAVVGVVVLLCLAGPFGTPAAVQAAEQDSGSNQPEFELATSTTAHGGAILFLFNTRTETLSVYEAEGGSRATRGVTFVGARKIARDIYVTGYNDKSEYTYQELLDRFEREEERVRSAEDDSEPGVSREQ